MSLEFQFFKTTMPESRKADYHLGCLDSCVFIDFNRTKDNLIFLARISFDGYGCCNLKTKSKHLGLKDSLEFIQEIEKDKLNQESILRLVREIIRVNEDQIWPDAIEEYELINNNRLHPT